MKYFCDWCERSYADHEVYRVVGSDEHKCPECDAWVSVLEPVDHPHHLPTLVTAQPAFTPSYATNERAERYATDGRYGGYVGVEVKASSGVWRLEQEEVAT